MTKQVWPERTGRVCDKQSTTGRRSNYPLFDALCHKTVFFGVLFFSCICACGIRRLHTPFAGSGRHSQAREFRTILTIFFQLPFAVWWDIKVKTSVFRCDNRSSRKSYHTLQRVHPFDIFQFFTGASHIKKYLDGALQNRMGGFFWGKMAIQLSHTCFSAWSVLSFIVNFNEAGIKEGGQVETQSVWLWSLAPSVQTNLLRAEISH